MGKLFGTDGIRGVANSYPMTPQFAMVLGKCAVYRLKKNNDRVKIVIGKDTRISCDMLEAGLIAGITSAGGDVLKVNVLPTPGISYLTEVLKADSGIVVSASHNPFDNNGIKFFGADGFKLKDEIEEQIEETLTKEIEFPLPTGEKIGRVIEIPEAEEKYLSFLKNTFKLPGGLKEKKIVIDGANGATSKIAPELFRRLGAEVVTVNCQPNGININLNCGALYPEKTAEIVKKEKADLGVCLDGDGDRIITIDEKGKIVDGDQIIVICAHHLKSCGKLKNNLAVVTITSNLGVDIALKELGIKLSKTKVGDRYVMEEMRDKGSIIGGEQSGHIIFFEYSKTGDGILSALQLLTVISEKKQPLSQLAQIMKKLPQVLINIPVKSKPDLNTIPEIKSVIEKIEDKLGQQGRVLVRYSGTEPKVRVMLEGPSKDEITQMAQEIGEAIKQKIG